MSEDHANLYEPSPSSRIQRAAAASNLIPDGDTKIHNHPESDKIWEAMCVYTLTPQSQRRSLASFEKDLKAEFDLDIDGGGQYTNWVLKEYVAPYAQVQPKWVREKLSEMDVSPMEVPIEEGRNLKKAVEKLNDAFDDPEAEYSDIATLIRAVQKLRNDFKQTLEKYEAVPSDSMMKEDTEGGDTYEINIGDIEAVKEEAVDTTGGVVNGDDLEG